MLQNTRFFLVIFLAQNLWLRNFFDKFNVWYLAPCRSLLEMKMYLSGTSRLLESLPSSHFLLSGRAQPFRLSTVGRIRPDHWSTSSLKNMDFVKSHVLSLKWQELRILTSATMWLSITFINGVISISQFVKKTCFNLIFQLALFMLQPNKDFRAGCLKNYVLSGMISREI